MSAVESEPEKRLDPGFKVKLTSNNPFRKANSPMVSPPADVSNPKNPFLDPDLVGNVQSQPRSPPKMASEAALRDMSLNDRRQPPGPGQAAARLLQMKPGESSGAGSSAGPSRRPDEKKRTPSEERRREERRERRRKEKEAGLTDSQGRPVPSGSGRSKRRGPHLDPIDKLDTTGAFLFGGGYHVAGPYDATVPKHANRRHAPIDAFAKDSLNMVMGGKANVDRHHHADHSKLYGHVEDAVNDFGNRATATTQPGTDPYNSARPTRRNETFDAHTKVEPIHGVETEGLGTSTFLDGTPAAASAIRRESESNDAPVGGLGRTRSIAQRFKSVRNRDRSDSSGVVYSPEPSYNRAGSPAAKGSLSGGGLNKINEKNPFFNDYDSAYDDKGDKIRAAKGGQVSVTLEDKGSAPSKPVPTQLTRSITEDSVVAQHQRTGSTDSQDAQRQGGGFLDRMKSLRGKKKERSQE